MPQPFTMAFLLQCAIIISFVYLVLGGAQLPVSVCRSYGCSSIGGVDECPGATLSSVNWTTYTCYQLNFTNIGDTYPAFEWAFNNKTQKWAVAFFNSTNCTSDSLVSVAGNICRAHQCCMGYNSINGTDIGGWIVDPSASVQTPPTPPPPNTLMYVLIAVGGALGLAIIGGLVYYFVIRKRGYQQVA